MSPKLKRQRGQGMTEYIIIIAVVAILTLGIVVRFGDSIRKLFVGSTEALSGQNPTASMTYEGDGQYNKELGGDWGTAGTP